MFILKIILIVSDVHLEILFQPIPLFPALGGFAVGLLIHAGFSVITELVRSVSGKIIMGLSKFQAITIVIYTYTGFVIILCLIYRHQTLVLAGNPLKFRKVRS